MTLKELKEYRAGKLKKGDLIEFHRYMSRNGIDKVVYYNQKNIWLKKGQIIDWGDVAQIYNREEHLEYFL